MRPACVFLVRVFFCALVVTSVPGADQKTENLDLSAARENPQLRSYFAGLHFTSRPDAFAQYRADSARPSEEWALALWQRKLIDVQIEEFVKEVHRKAENLEEHWKHLDELRTEDRNPRTWGAELEEIEKEANSLRGSLKAAFPGLSEKKSDELQPDTASLRKDPEPEIVSLGRHVREVKKMLSDLLFQPTYVTSVAALRAGSPLDFLKRISATARAVRQSM